MNVLHTSIASLDKQSSKDKANADEIIYTLTISS